MGDAGWKKRKTSRRATAHRLRWNFESRKVSTSLQHRIGSSSFNSKKKFSSFRGIRESCSQWTAFHDEIHWTLAYLGLGAAWTATLIFDSLVFSMTLYKAIVLPRPNGVNIMDILLRDGELYITPWGLFFLNQINTQGRSTSGRLHILFWFHPGLDKCMYRVMLVSNLANVLTFMVRASSLFITSFLKYFSLFPQLGGVSTFCNCSSKMIADSYA